MDIEQIAAAAAAELDQARDAKVQTIRNLATSGEQVMTLRAQLAEAEREHARVYQTALRADWDEKAIKRLGLPVPERRAGGRPRKSDES